MGYYSLLAVIDEAQTLKEEYDSQPPLCCPNDATPLSDGPDGIVFCPFDGWQWDGTSGVN